MENKPQIINASRGTQLWAFNHFRSSVLGKLLDDLVDMEEEGLDDELCKKVRISLDHFVNATTAIPKGGILSGGPISKDAGEFAEIYKTWNDVSGKSAESIAQRRKALGRLRKKRQKIANKISKMQFEIQNNLDHKLLMASYNGLEELISFVPSVFKNLSSALSDFLKRKGKPD
jgi:hypothetical protein